MSQFNTPEAGKGRLYMVKCPLCLWSHVLVKTGKTALQEGKSLTTRKGQFLFNKGDMDTIPFIDVREGSKGQGRNFARLDKDCLSLKEAMQRKQYQELIAGLRDQIGKINKILENEQ